MCWQLILPSFRTPSTLQGRDGSQLPCSWKSSRCTAPHSPKLTLLGTHSVHTWGKWWTSALQISRHPWLDLGRNSSEKSFLDIFIKAVDLWNQTTFCSRVHTSFHWKGFLGPNISEQKEHSHHKSYSSSNPETRATVFQVLIACIAPDKCYLLSCKSLVSLIQSNFGLYLDFFLVNRSFRGFIPISAAADLAVSYQWFGSERPPPKHHNKHSYFRAVMPSAQLFPVQEVPSGGACRLWSYPFERVM